MAESPTARAARENLFIRKLKNLPGGMFEAVVAKLTAGETAAHVARWIVSQQPTVNWKVAEACWSEKTTEVYVGALRRKVQGDIKKAKSIAPEPFVYRAVLEEAQLAVKGDITLIDEEVRKSMKGQGEIFSMVQKQVLSMNAQTMLKYCFMIQQARVKKMRELEESLGMLFPEGYKNMQVLSDIASDIAKLEVGDLWMHGKSPLYKGSIVPDTSGSEMKREQGPFAKRVAELGEVDRNLIRIASDKIIDLIREEAKGGITTEQMEAHTGGIEEGKAENSSPDNLQDDSGG